MYKFIGFLITLLVAFFFFSWVIDRNYFEIHQNEILLPNDGLVAKRFLYVWSESLDVDSFLNDELKNQLTLSIDFYNKGLCRQIIVAGDKDHVNGNIVLEMMDFLIQGGVPVENIIPDFYSPSIYNAVYRLKNVYELFDFYVLSDVDALLNFLYISDKLNLELEAISFRSSQGKILERIFSEWSSLIKTKAFSPDVYVADKNPNFLLNY